MPRCTVTRAAFDTSHAALYLGRGKNCRKRFPSQTPVLLDTSAFRGNSLLPSSGFIEESSKSSKRIVFFSLGFVVVGNRLLVLVRLTFCTQEARLSRYLFSSRNTINNDSCNRIIMINVD